jgi:rubrerythrin
MYKKGIIMSKTLNDLLTTAIQDEIGAQKFYLGAMEKTKNVRLKEFFKSLAAEEKGHERILTGVKEMGIYDGDLPVDEEMVRKIEGAHIIPGEESIEAMSLERAMEVAMKKETKASKIYAEMEKTNTQEELKKLFSSLSSDESRHARIIDEQYRIYTGQMGREG